MVNIIFLLNFNLILTNVCYSDLLTSINPSSITYPQPTDDLGCAFDDTTEHIWCFGGKLTNSGTKTVYQFNYTAFHNETLLGEGIYNGVNNVAIINIIAYLTGK